MLMSIVFITIIILWLSPSKHLLTFIITFILIALLKSFGGVIAFQVLLTGLAMTDEYSFWLSLMTCIIVYMSFISASFDLSLKSFELINLSFFSLLFVSLVVFSTSNLLLLYIFYEISLLPILFIIIKWGVYPDRFVSAVMMLVYTTLFSFPLMISILLFFEMNSPSIVFLGSFASPMWVTALIFISFSVKLPVYGLHYWLPMAHVEAPTFGSMILAGILLKLGGCAMVRFSSVTDYFGLGFWLVFYFAVSIVIVSLIASFQSDFKRLVAYSSVVHMTILVLSLFTMVGISYKSILMVMTFHGFVSPYMFMIVGTVYKFCSTRMMSVLHGLLSQSYVLSTFMVLMFLMNVPTPPFAPFLAEVSLFLGFVNYFPMLSIFVFFYVLLAVVFNISWLSALVFGSSSSFSTTQSTPGIVDVVSGTLVSSVMLFGVFLVFLFYAYISF